MPRYFWMYIWFFWVPIAILLPLLWRVMDRFARKALVLSLLLVFWPASVAMEYICLKLDVWDFSQAWDPLIGWRLFGAPVEEFVFWFGAPFIVLLVYIGIDYLDRTFLRARSPK